MHLLRLAVTIFALIFSFSATLLAAPVKDNASAYLLTDIFKLLSVQNGTLTARLTLSAPSCAYELQGDFDFRLGSDPLLHGTLGGQQREGNEVSTAEPQESYLVSRENQVWHYQKDENGHWTKKLIKIAAQENASVKAEEEASNTPEPDLVKDFSLTSDKKGHRLYTVVLSGEALGQDIEKSLTQQMQKELRALSPATAEMLLALKSGELKAYCQSLRDSEVKLTVDGQSGYLTQLELDMTDSLRSVLAQYLALHPESAQDTQTKTSELAHKGKLLLVLTLQNIGEQEGLALPPEAETATELIPKP